jgi:16S rRNA (adenine1518-N6/adenine1519-N6)-dimethyltransferase
MANITFVDENDNVIGAGTRADAWSKGIIHRIVRIFVLNPAGELLIQKRAATVDSPNKWDQSAGGHVDEGEDYLTAALRELAEEIGITGLTLTEVTKFFTDAAGGQTKKRFNMLYKTIYSGNELRPDKSEVAETRWINLAELGKWMQENPQDFTRGFIQSYNLFIKE